jgi:thiamine pyrophosphate-dependent acetolactate synthase large subunit-like protein
MKTPAAFPTDHPLHPAEPRSRPSPISSRITKEADVILALDWMDLKGHFIQTLGRDAPVRAQVIHCSIDEHLHNGWSMDYCGLPPADIKFLCSPDQLVGPLLEAVRKLRGTADKAEPKFPVRVDAPLPAPRKDGIMSLLDLALVLREFCDGREVTIANYALGWPSDTVRFTHPLDYLGYGTGIGLGPSRSVGVALALKGTSRLPVAVVGDGDFTMGNTAFWTAAHMGIPLLVVVANNQVYHNDVGHQAHIARTRGRPVENKFIGQEMMHPACDLAAMARAQGIEGEGPIMNSGDFAKALLRGENIVRAGGLYVIDARVDVRTTEEADRGQTVGRKE